MIALTWMVLMPRSFMKLISAGAQTADSPNLGSQSVGSQKVGYRTMYGVVAAAMIASSIMVGAGQAHAKSAIASFPMPTFLAQASPGGGTAAASDSSEDTPYRILLGVALVFAVVSGIVYMRSDS
jgi:hypothetical protein